MNNELRTIGLVHSLFKEPGQCPRQGNARCPEVWIEIFSEYTKGLRRLKIGQEIIVLTWLHLASRDVLQCHPGGDVTMPLHGVFATRSPNRPNPIGLHQVRILDIVANKLLVHPLEVVDQTPVIDLKPVLIPKKEDISGYFSLCNIQELIQIARDGWNKGLLNGFNGNLSVRDGGYILITNSGAAKGHLNLSDLAVIDIDSGQVVKGSPSSETQMHLQIYRHQKKAKAIVHTHPPHLLALSLIAEAEHEMFDLPLFEAKTFMAQMAVVPALAPGSRELAEAAGTKARFKRCLFLQKHGLVCWGDNLKEALALSEELDGLARIELLGRKRRS